MFMPSGEIFLTDGVGNITSVMITDLNTKKELIEELNYLFNKCGYDKSKYFEAIYKRNNRTIFKLLIEDI